MLASGLSNSLHFYLKLVNSKSRALSEQGETVILRYNVWEKVYIIRFSTGETHFNQFQHFVKFVNDSLVFKLGKTQKLPLNQKLQIILSFSLEKISDSQKSRLRRWLKNEGEFRESQPALESRSGFSINLTSLISIFLPQKNSDRIYIYKSRPFTIQSLKLNENITQ